MEKAGNLSFRHTYAHAHPHMHPHTHSRTLTRAHARTRERARPARTHARAHGFFKYQVFVFVVENAVKILFWKTLKSTVFCSAFDYKVLILEEAI